MARITFEYKGLKFDAYEINAEQYDRTAQALFAYAEGASFTDTYNTAFGKPKETNFITTVDGIKNFADGKTYQCSYNCATCGNRGRRFIRQDAETCECHNCKQILNVVPANDNGEPDGEFNYFVAY